jgi:hypothetical protein
VFNAFAPELWRRTLVRLDRLLTRLCKGRQIDPKTVRVSYGKVCEMQRRAVVHFHAIFRLDGVDPDDKDAVVPAPAGIGLADLLDALAAAATGTSFTTPEHPTRPGWAMAWGEQLDLRPVRVPSDREINDQMVAGYLAKYATKSTEITGHVSGRITRANLAQYADPAGDHIERLIHACWTLGGYDHRYPLSQQDDRPYGGLRRWAHMLGFGGHFLTKSRRYSVTFTVLRQARVIWQRSQHQDLVDEHDQQTVVLMTELAYVGTGWHTTGDAILANTSAAMAREQQRVAREEMASRAA